MLKLVFYLMVALGIFVPTRLKAHPPNLKEKFNSQSFSIRQPASKEDWLFFMQSEQNWRKSLWKFFSKRNHQLKDWSWTWRLAWIRVCEHDEDQWCSRIMYQGLFDRALIVRAKTANSWGRRFYGTKNKKAGKILEKAFHLSENNRKGKPMFVKNRILFALKNIGGNSNQILGKQLASSRAETQSYWNNLQKK